MDGQAPDRLPGWLRATLCGLSVVLIGIAMAVLARGRDAKYFDPGIGLLVVAWLLAATASCRSWRPVSGLCAALHRWRLRRPAGWWWVALVAVVLVGAAVIRLLPLGSIPPPGVPWYEELQTGGIASGILDLGDRPLDYPLVNYATAVAFKLLGPSTLSLRLPTILMGWLTVVLFLATARHLFRPPVALFTTAMFAVSRWHVHVNHVADENAPPVILLMAVLYLLVTVRTAPHPLRWLALGSLYGLVPAVYPGYRFVLAMVPLHLAGAWLWRRLRRSREAPQTERAAAIAGFVLGCAIVAAPLVVAVAKGDPRAAIAVNLSRDHSFQVPMLAGVEWQRSMELASVVFRFMFLDLSCEWVSAGGRPAMEPIAAALSLLGLAWALATLWRPLRGTIVLWVPIVTYLGTVAIGATYLHRLCAIIPMLYLAQGFAVDDAWRCLERSRKVLLRVVVAVVLLAAVGFETAGNIGRLFGQYPRDGRVRELWENLSRELPVRSRQILPVGWFYLWSDLRDPIHYFRPSEVTWLTGELQGRAMLSLFDALPRRDGPATVDALIGLRLFRRLLTRAEVDAMAAYFHPEMVADSVQETSPLGRIGYHYYRLPAAVAIARNGLHGRYFRRSNGQWQPVMERVDRLDGGDSWRDAEFAGPMAAVWTGLGFVDTTAVHGFRVTASGPAALLVDGLPVLERGLPGCGSGELHLDRGWHTVQLVVRGLPDDVPPVLEVSPAGGEPAPFPRRDLFAMPRLRGISRSWVMRRDGREEVYLRRIEPTVSQHMVEALLRTVREERDGAELVQERWQGWFVMDSPADVAWHLRVRQGTATLAIDGDPLLVVPPAGGGLSHDGRATARLEEGAHRLELVFDYDFRGDYHGGVELGWSTGSHEPTVVSPERLLPVAPGAILSVP